MHSTEKEQNINDIFPCFLLEDAPPPLPEVPEHATYILVGAGTASFAAYRAIRKADNNAKVHVFMYYSQVCVSHHVQ